MAATSLKQRVVLLYIFSQTGAPPQQPVVPRRRSSASPAWLLVSLCVVRSIMFI